MGQGYSELADWVKLYERRRTTEHEEERRRKKKKKKEKTMKMKKKKNEEEEEEEEKIRTEDEEKRRKEEEKRRRKEKEEEERRKKEEQQSSRDGKKRSRRQRSKPDTGERKVSFQNDLDRSVDIYWVPPEGQKEFKMSIEPGVTSGMNTYVGHRFIAQSKRGSEAKMKVSRSTADQTFSIG